MAGEELIGHCVARVRQQIPEAVAVFLGGSLVRGDAGPFSDVDIDVVVADGPRDEWPTWFDQYDGRSVRVDVWIRDVDRWLAEEEQPQSWAFGLPCADPLRLCWVADESWRQRLDRSQLTHPAGPPELGHFISDLAKVANARSAGDELALRLAAQDLAVSVPALLQPLNAGPPLASRYSALRAALAVDVAPAGYPADLLTCLGLTGRPTTAEDLYAAATRLASGMIELLETHRTAYTAPLTTDQINNLSDGSLRRYVTHVLNG
jgi:hypothetical protein